MLEKIEEFIMREYKLKVIYNAEICDYISNGYEMISRYIIPDCKTVGINPALPLICFVDKDELDAFERKDGDDCYIVIYSGIINLQKEHLEKAFVRRGKKVEETYIKKIMDYTIMFVILHEYIHYLCGHYLLENNEKIAQEYEADTEALKFLVNKIFFEYDTEEIEHELVVCFVAIFYFFKSIEAFCTDERYKVHLLENHYIDGSYLLIVYFLYMFLNCCCKNLMFCLSFVSFPLN